ncbi:MULTISPECIES: ABC transporter substrate-binding protein [Providencia]|uniref:ABC transporter substrate-binding protein n=1 Tax=Providencia TaxID=586 RepID=UPI0015EC7625|nr:MULTISPECIES: ABC transporter substrate-binding protein [Providencia]QLQ65847.1 ABC transporter substrate-binding protein [Providencia rettgeri]URR22059.1 ABC transporter substrate-binding protein [Providencia rettgeri]
MKLFLTGLLCLLSFWGQAKTPTVITDLQGREVTVNLPVEKLFLVDSRDILPVDIAAGKSGISRIAGWSDSLTQYAPDLKQAYFSVLPELDKIPTLKKTREAGLQVEKLIELMPDVVIMHKANYGAMRDSQILPQLEAAGIQVIFIDFRMDIAKNTPKSILLLGKLLGTQERAEQFAKLYQEKLDAIESQLAQPFPAVLIEANAGLFSDNCCQLYGRSGYGSLAALAGGNNLVADSFPAKGAESSIENIITLNPEYYLLTGADWHNFNRRSLAVSLGYNANKANVQKQLSVLMDRQGISSLTAVKEKRVMAIYHNFYNNPMNIFAIEAMAKFMHPERFSALNPEQNLVEFQNQFTEIRETGVFWVSL